MWVWISLIPRYPLTHDVDKWPLNLYPKPRGSKIIHKIHSSRGPGNEARFESHLGQLTLRRESEPSHLVVLCCLALFGASLICNDVHMHTVYNRFKQTEREKQLFSLKGSDCRSQRMAIYSFLLSHMTDAHRFQLTAKLCQEVQEHTNTYTPTCTIFRRIDTSLE